MIMTSTKAVTRDAIAATYARIAPHIRQTPVLAVRAQDFGLAGGALSLKLELTQHSGSFKARGAFANLLMREVPPAGVAAASGGNHGAAVAYAARQLGHKARIFVPEISSPAKIARIRGYGADLAVGGKVYAEALAAYRTGTTTGVTRWLAHCAEAVAINSIAQQASPNCSGQIEFFRPQLYRSCIEVTQTPCLCSSVRNCSSIWLMGSRYKRYVAARKLAACNNVTLLAFLTSA
jgi:hypothetical protein